MDCSIAKRALGTSQGGGERGGKMDVKRKKEKKERNKGDDGGEVEVNEWISQSVIFRHQILR